MEFSHINCCIIIPAHIYANSHITYLDECLQSLINQTLVIPVYLSISFDNNRYEQDFDNLIKKYGLSKDKATRQLIVDPIGLSKDKATRQLIVDPIGLSKDKAIGQLIIDPIGLSKDKAIEQFIVEPIDKAFLKIIGINE